MDLRKEKNELEVIVRNLNNKILGLEKEERNLKNKNVRILEDIEVNKEKIKKQVDVICASEKELRDLEFQKNDIAKQISFDRQALLLEESCLSDKKNIVINLQKKVDEEALKLKSLRSELDDYRKSIDKKDHDVIDKLAEINLREKKEEIALNKIKEQQNGIDEKIDEIKESENNLKSSYIELNNEKVLIGETKKEAESLMAEAIHLMKQVNQDKAILDNKKVEFDSKVKEIGLMTESCMAKERSLDKQLEAVEDMKQTAELMQLRVDKIIKQNGIQKEIEKLRQG